DLAVKIFGNLEGIRTLILGAGEMSSIAAKHLASRGSEIEILVHRNRKRARDLALKVSGVTVEPELFEQRLEKVDIVAAATSAKYKLLTCDAVKSILGRRRGRPLFLIDLANPRNFESGIGELEGAYLYDLDDFEKIASRHRERRLQAVAEAEQIVESSLENWARIEKLMTQSDVIALAHINLMKMEADLGEKLNTPLLRKQARKQLRRLFHVSRMSLLEDNDIQREINVEVFKSIFGVSSRQLP
ncbi:MAG: hypothetical protein JKX97_01910, partial [Candidatus Lindowbacteria bacterium]|nr:hypothetical protein [Candidatus Lindowbacteria bacterium]